MNSLSLILPLITVHYAAGRKFFEKGIRSRLSWRAIPKLDGIYYAGVTLMGFWLFIGEAATPFSAWLSFAASYLAVVAIRAVYHAFDREDVEKIRELAGREKTLHRRQAHASGMMEKKACLTSHQIVISKGATA